MIYKFREWEFEVDYETTRRTYDLVSRSGAEECGCNNCKNYVACRESVFPKEVITFFSDIGVDYRKEVEITDYQKVPNGLHHVGGWFHFEGQILSGKDCRVFTDDSKTGWTLDLTSIDEMFSMGFHVGSDLAYFENKVGLVQVEFEAKIPWVIDKALESD